jgi:Zn-dependent peptidase ImmA (M78 family)/DNA-binding XRE family transcriptional regulator
MSEKATSILRGLREQLGITQEGLGKLVGVTRQTIASWESADTKPTLAESVGLAMFLNVPVEVLLGQDSEQSGLLFRADDTTPLTAELRMLLSKKARDYHALELVLNLTPTVPLSRPLDDFDPFMVKFTAAEVRNWLGVGDCAPLSNVFAVLENEGLKIIQYPLPNDVSGFSAYTDETGALIVVNSNQPSERQYFTCMHELGHLIFHRKEYMRGSAEGRKQRKKDPKEKASDKLAGEVMLPDKVVYAELKSLKGRGWIPEPILRDLKKRYWVSMSTILYRARDLGILSESDFGKQIGWIGRNKIEYKEENKLDAPPGLNRLQRLTFEALLNDAITTNFAATLLGWSLHDINSSLNIWIQGEAQLDTVV